MIFTKKPKLEKFFMCRASARDLDLLRAAAELQEVSQSDFVRQVVRHAAKRILADSKTNKGDES